MISKKSNYNRGIKERYAILMPYLHLSATFPRLDFKCAKADLQWNFLVITLNMMLDWYFYVSKTPFKSWKIYVSVWFYLERNYEAERFVMKDLYLYHPAIPASKFLPYWQHLMPNWTFRHYCPFMCSLYFHITVIPAWQKISISKGLSCN